VKRTREPAQNGNVAIGPTSGALRRKTYTGESTLFTATNPNILSDAYKKKARATLSAPRTQLHEKKAVD